MLGQLLGWLLGGKPTRPARAQNPKRLWRLEELEVRLVPALNPTGFEQELLEMINRMRSDPASELAILTNSLGTPATSTDPDVNAALAYFNVSGSTLAAQWSTLSAVPPLAWNEALCDAAEGHNQAMIAADTQSHQVPGEPDLSTRAVNAGYTLWTSLAENIFGYAESVFHAHAGFAIDWGTGDGGIQTPPGHRNNIMNGGYQEIGVSIIEDSSPTTDLGPLVVTQDFGNRIGIGNPYILGVVFDDANSNGFYNASEGLGQLIVEVSGTGGTYVTTTMSAGGYQLQVPAGSYTVTVRGDGYATTSQDIVVGSDNVKVDFTPDTTSFDLTGPTSGSYTAGEVVAIQWTASGVVSGATISLCYDEDTTWWNGNEHWIEVDQVAAAEGTASYNWDTSGVAAGNYYIAGYMYDPAGTFTPSHLMQSIQIAAGASQTLDLTGPTSGTYTAGEAVTIEWTASGVVPGATISLCYDEDTTWWNGNEHWIEVDQVAASDGNGSYEWDTSGVGAGTYYVAGYMYDSAGTFTFSRLTQAIQIAGAPSQSFDLTGPASGTYTAGDVVTLEWTAGGVVPGATISLCYDEDTTWWNGNEHWIEVDQVAASDGNGNYEWNTTNVAAGTYYLAGYMYDYAGSFTYSRLASAIEIAESQGQSFDLTGPTSGTFTAGDVVPIEWTAGGVVSGARISLCYDEDTTWWNGNEHWIEVDQVVAANGSGTFNWDTSGVAAGTYYLAGYMYDFAQTAIFSHLIQAVEITGAVAQTFELTGPTSGVYTVGDVIPIEWTAGGVVSGAKISLCYDEDTTWWNGNEHWIEVDQVTATNGTDSYNWDTAAVSPGTYYVAGYMYDFVNTSIFSRLNDSISIVASGGSLLLDVSVEELAVASEASDNGEGPTELTTDELETIADRAIVGWEQAGMDTESLQQVSFVVADLPGAELGLATVGTIYLDVDAAGRSWFIDSTPGQNEEFERVDGVLRAIDPEVMDQVDLLTVLYHELGHSLGLEDLAAGVDCLMSSVLPVGVRREPQPAAVDTAPEGA